MIKTQHCEVCRPIPCVLNDYKKKKKHCLTSKAIQNKHKIVGQHRLSTDCWMTFIMDDQS